MPARPHRRASQNACPTSSDSQRHASNMLRPSQRTILRRSTDALLAAKRRAPLSASRSPAAKSSSSAVGATCAAEHVGERRPPACSTTGSRHGTGDTPALPLRRRGCLGARPAGRRSTPEARRSSGPPRSSKRRWHPEARSFSGSVRRTGRVVPTACKASRASLVESRLPAVGAGRRSTTKSRRSAVSGLSTRVW